MTGDDLPSALTCLRSWDPEARVIGNVRCSTLIALLERSELEQNVINACLSSDEHDVDWVEGVAEAADALRETSK